MITERELLERARQLRRNPTECEVRVWRQLSNSQTGFKFRRQAVIFPYICDFLCPAKAMIVEIDGDTHDRIYDERRDAYLESRGYKVMRFANGDVRDTLEGVMQVIVAACRERPNRWPGEPHPNPSPEGEGLEA
ncbi:endonuclease domain-containing protein [Sphingomonas sp. GC_Shp_1]|uniref:endonuclease domain-containing protein n=1 Tax=unclassified Sphingomonas TaxID=196159 RepID=UPI00226A9225